MIQYLYRNFHDSIFHVQYFFAKLFSILFSKFGFLAKFSHFNLPSSEFFRNAFDDSFFYVQFFFSQNFSQFYFLSSVFSLNFLISIYQVQYFFAMLLTILFSTFSFFSQNFSHFISNSECFAKLFSILFSSSGNFLILFNDSVCKNHLVCSNLMIYVSFRIACG